MKEILSAIQLKLISDNITVEELNYDQPMVACCCTGSANEIQSILNMCNCEFNYQIRNNNEALKEIMSNFQEPVDISKLKFFIKKTNDKSFIQKYAHAMNISVVEAYNLLKNDIILDITYDNKRFLINNKIDYDLCE